MAGSAKDRVVYPLQKRVVNPSCCSRGGWASRLPATPSWRRRGGTPDRHGAPPSGDGPDGEIFWLVAQRGRRADWVQNIQANPRVRVKVRTPSGVGWRAGTAHIRDDDDPRERQRRIGQGNLARGLCVRASAAVGTSPLTVRIHLDIR